MLRPSLLLLGLAACAPPPAEGPLELDRYGGLSAISFAATGFFRAERTADRNWLVTPDGAAFFSAGVNVVSFNAARARRTATP